MKGMIVLEWTGRNLGRCFLLTLGAATLFGQSLSFQSVRRDVPIRGTPQWVAVADFNQDGKLDIAVASTEPGRVTLLQGAGDGSFELSLQMDAVAPVFLLAADFNGDTRPDLAVASTSGDISVLIGNGDGSFQTARTVRTSGSAKQLAAADFDGDSKLDLAVSHEQGNRLTILRGNGDGTLQATGTVDVGMVVSMLVAGDLNRDAKADLVAIAGGKALVLEADGAGGFGRPQVIGGAGEEGVVLGDFNGDGILDLATATWLSVSLWFGNGDSSFRDPIEYQHPNADTPFAPYPIVADWNKDGKLDLAVGRRSGAAILLGRGDGALTIGQDSLGAGACPGKMAAADFNGDGSPDLVVVNSCSESLSVFVGNGDGTLHPPLYSVPAPGATILLSADLNLDGRPDIIAGDALRRKLMLLAGTVDGALEQLGNIEIPITGRGIEDLNAILVDDFNGDTHPDLLVAAWDLWARRCTLWFLAGNGDGTFAKGISSSLPFNARGMWAGDFNRDGKRDLVLVTNGANSAAEGDTNRIYIYLGAGDGSFEPATDYDVPGTADVLVSDVNGDDIPDLIAASTELRAVLVFLGLGDGSFQEKQRIAFIGRPYSVAAADFDGNGTKDLAIVDLLQFSVFIAPGEGNGTFGAARGYRAGNLPSKIFASDLNGDGAADLAVVSGASNSIVAFQGRGDGTFLPANHFSPGASLGAAVLGDFNGDAKPDLVTLLRASADGGNRVVLLGNLAR